MPHVMVGKQKCRVSWAEWFCCIIPEGTPVAFTRKNDRSGKDQKGYGVFLGSHFYDGINAEIDIGGDTVRVFPDHGDRVRRIRDTADYPFLGAGI